MELTITEKVEQKEMNRTFGKASVLFEGPVPSRKDIVEEIAKKASVDKNLVVAKKISSVFGKTKAVVSFYIYNDEKSKSGIIQKHMQKRHEFKEEAPAEEAETKEETPAEDKTEEKKE